jgi:hypothetical protein
MLRAPGGCQARGARRGGGVKRIADHGLRATFIALLALACATGARAESDRLRLPELVLTRVPAAATEHVTEHGFAALTWRPDGAEVVRYDPATGALRILSARLASATDPIVAFDGRHVLFAGKRSVDESWQIWRVDLDGGDLTQITREAGAALEPCVVGTLFHLDDAVPVERLVYVGRTGADGEPQVWACNLDGSSVERLTWLPGASVAPEVLPSGDLVFASWLPADLNPTMPVGSLLMTMAIDGADLRGYSGGARSSGFVRDLRAGADRRLYWIASDPAEPLGGGALWRLERRRPSRSSKVLAVASDGWYRAPAPLTDGRLLASFRPRGAASTYRIVTVDPTTGTRGAELCADRRFHYLDARELAPRTPVHGRASVVDNRKETGVFYCVSAHISDRFAAAELAAAHRVRVVEAVPLSGRADAAAAARRAFPLGTATGTAATATIARVLGSALVERDGSFHVEVPARTPVAFQLLDEHGRSVTPGHDWVSVMPREWRGCIGCHEGPERTPPNVVPAAVAKPASVLTPPAAERPATDFVRDIAPLMVRTCARAGCHERDAHPPSLAVGEPSSDADLLARYTLLVAPCPDGRRFVVPGSARTSSALAHALEISTTAPDTAAAPTASELETLAEWIDLGAPFDTGMIGGRREAGAEKDGISRESKEGSREKAEAGFRVPVPGPRDVRRGRGQAQSLRGHNVLASLLVQGGRREPSKQAPRVGSRERVGSEPRTSVPGSRSSLPQFVDVTRAAGINWQHSIADDDLHTIVASSGSGCAFLDYDSDGWLDIYLVNGRYLKELSPPRMRSLDGTLRNALYRNNGNGTFTDVTGKAGVGGNGFGMAVLAADFDNDGDADIFLTSYHGNTLYRNNGDDTFADVTAKAGLVSSRFNTGCTFLDVDRDGWLDLFVGGYLVFDPDYRGFYAADGFPGPLSYRAEQSSLYRNHGDGTFEDVSGKAGLLAAGGRAMGAAASDLDGDGHVDIFVANDAMENYLYRNRGDGTFVNVALAAGTAFGQNGETTSAMGPELGDFDNDGRVDVLVPNIRYGSVYRNLGGGRFEEQSARLGLATVLGQYTGWSGNLFDFDADGWLDILIANGNAHHLEPEEVVLVRNLGGTRFVDVARQCGANLQEKYVGRGSAVGDFDNDGDLDVLILNLNARPRLLRNDGGNRAHWLSIHTVGTVSNHDGIGARITVHAGGQTQIREVRSSAGYLSQGDPRVYFGLGAAALVDQLEIRWPSGRLQVLERVKADQVLTVTEPKTTEAAK